MTNKDKKLAMNQLIDQIIQSSDKTVNSNKAIVDDLVSHLCDITHIDLHPDFFTDENATRTSKGKAVSMTTAAQCAEEYLRTQVFIRGVNQAIEDQLAQNKKVNLLYGGTGPFGLLVLPLLHRFSDQELQITLLDIHQESLNLLAKVIQTLDVSSYIKQVQCTDILEWEVPEKEYDIIVSETMMALLANEPQVSIFRHLIPSLKDTGCLIPQQVVLDAWLKAKYKGAKPQHIGNFFTLSKTTSQELNQQTTPTIESSFIIPSYEGHSADLHYTTQIQAYGDHWLTDNQCSLNLPRIIANEDPEPAGIFTASYSFSDFPQFIFKYPKHKDSIKEDTPLPAPYELNSLSLPYLKRMWHCAQSMKKQHKNIIQVMQQEHSLQSKCFDILQLGLEPTLQILFASTVEDEFTDYILQQNQGKISDTQSKMLLQCVNQHFASLEVKQEEEQEEQKEQTSQDIEKVLDQQQIQFWEENGYLIIPKVLDNNECQQLISEICNFIGISLDKPSTWYRPSIPLQKIMVPLFDSPMQKAIRNKTNIHKVFYQLWQSNNLLVSTDRASFNPPETAEWQFQGPNIHLDLELKTPVPFGTQGMIYLTDTSEKQGAFCCIPKFHKEFNQWLQNIPSGQDPQKQPWSDLGIKPIAANAGDLIIWHHALPHGSSSNTATQPRIVQYINMQPAN